jgi:biopolymer transport protein ExbD
MGKPRVPEDTPPMNIMPLMNIIMLLIPFLIMSTEFIKLGVINVTAPKMGSASTQSKPKEDLKKKPLNLTVSVTDKGLTLITRNAKIPEGCDLSSLNKPGEKKLPTIKKVGSKYNFDSLTTCLDTIKKLSQDEKQIIIMAEPEIKFDVIVSIMDASRSSNKFPQNQKEGKEGLFPQVILSAGVL